jgi:hypothetical protein
MPATGLSELIPLLQVAVGPVILISGVGLLLLSFTNRFSHTVDRSRQLLHDMREAGESDRRHLAGQVGILYRRARLIQISIILASMSALFAALLIFTLFFTALMRWESVVGLGFLVSLLFIICVLTLVASLVTFIVDIHLSLRAFRLEMGQQNSGPAK